MNAYPGFFEKNDGSILDEQPAYSHTALASGRSDAPVPPPVMTFASPLEAGNEGILGAILDEVRADRAEFAAAAAETAPAKSKALELPRPVVEPVIIEDPARVWGKPEIQTVVAPAGQVEALTAAAGQVEDYSHEDELIDQLGMTDIAREALRSRLMRAAESTRQRSTYEVVFIILAASVGILLTAPALTQLVLALHGTPSG